MPALPTCRDGTWYKRQPSCCYAGRELMHAAVSRLTPLLLLFPNPDRDAEEFRFGCSYLYSCCHFLLELLLFALYIYTSLSFNHHLQT